MAASHVRILGVNVDVLPMAEAAALICERARDTKQPATYVVKPYVEFLDQAHRQPKMRDLLNDAWLSLPDAVSLQWAAAYLAGPPGLWRAFSLAAQIVLNPTAVRTVIPERYGGATFTWKLLEAAAAHKLRVYLVGSPKQSTIGHTAAVLRQKLPALNVIGTWPGRLGNRSGGDLIDSLEHVHIEQDLVEDLKSKQADLVLVGMGFPLQEMLCAKITGQLDHGVLIGEGGTFDYDSFGGIRKKAPVLIQRLGLEWLWRLILEPNRLRRQLAIPRFMWAVYSLSKRDIVP